MGELPDPRLIELEEKEHFGQLTDAERHLLGELLQDPENREDYQALAKVRQIFSRPPTRPATAEEKAEMRRLLSGAPPRQAAGVPSRQSAAVRPARAWLRAAPLALAAAVVAAVVGHWVRLPGEVLIYARRPIPIPSQGIGGVGSPLEGSPTPEVTPPAMLSGTSGEPFWVCRPLDIVEVGGQMMPRSIVAEAPVLDLIPLQTPSHEFTATIDSEVCVREEPGTGCADYQSVPVDYTFECRRSDSARAQKNGWRCDMVSVTTDAGKPVPFEDMDPTPDAPGRTWNHFIYYRQPDIRLVNADFNHKVCVERSGKACKQWKEERVLGKVRCQPND